MIIVCLVSTTELLLKIWPSSYHKKRYTPGNEETADTIGPRIYATYNPAFAVAHSFPWSSKDGIDIKIETDTSISIVIPKDKRAILNQEICIYTLPDDTFVQTTEEESGLTYHSLTEVTPLNKEIFATVRLAMEHFGGHIIEIE